MHLPYRRLVVALFALWISTTSTHVLGDEVAQQEEVPLNLVVMDPLAEPLSCPCVEGYAQRKYESLQTLLQSKLKRPVNLLFTESLTTIKRADLKNGSIDLVIGKDSVVRYDTSKIDLKASPIARLTDKEGSTNQYGLLVVAKDDPAKSPADLQDHLIYFGSADSQEKHEAAIELLTAAGIKLPKKLETSPACSDGACKILELEGPQKGAAVISSYAVPLLEGCGTIKKGDLRVVGKTKEVPFITAFVSDHVAAAERNVIKEELLQMVNDPALCQKLETLIGFVPIEDATDDTKKK